MSVERESGREVTQRQVRYRWLASFKWLSKRVIEIHESHSQNKTVYCTFRIFRVSFLHHRHGYFVLFPDLFPLGSDAVLEVEDSDTPLCYPVPITIFLHDRTMSIIIEETNHQALAGCCSPSLQCTCEYYRHKLTFWHQPGPSRSKGVFFVKVLPFILFTVWKTHIELLAVEQSLKVNLVENLWCPLGYPSVVTVPLKFPVSITNICRWVRLAYQFPGALVCVAIAGDGGNRNGRQAGLDKFTVNIYLLHFLALQELTVCSTSAYPNMLWWNTAVDHSATQLPSPYFFHHG